VYPKEKHIFEMLEVQLKEQTRAEHTAVEKKLLTRITGIEHLTHYVSLLATLYGFYFAIETSIQRFVDHSVIPDFDRRRKAETILNDMASLTSDVVVPELCTNTPSIASHYSALGAMYVLEGSTLGGQYIARMVTKKLNCKTGLNFFLSYGDDVQKKWDEFRMCLRKPFTEEQRTEIVTAAKQTFQTLDNWLDTHDKDKL
jgi:heme oxygenase (biliverdin-IX-beta and delta-forming)